MDAPLRILLASADPVQAVLAARLIQKLEHPAPRRVRDWRSALDATREDRADVWLVDAVLLPRDDAPSPVAPPPRIIAITASADALDDVPAHRFDDVLRAPLSLETLSAALRPVRRGADASHDDFSGSTWSELLKLFGRSGVAELLGALQRDLPPTQARKQQAAASRDLADLKRIAHSLRGASLQLGADDLAQLCANAEQAALDGSDAAVDLCAQAMARYGVLIERLADELRRL